ncbi:MAG: purine-binding chemotaxis protein CheW [Cytophagales bacterium]|nr:purine-binding chemotaxis protein CheW [Cytophagales bacterium]
MAFGINLKKRHSLTPQLAKGINESVETLVSETKADIEAAEQESDSEEQYHQNLMCIFTSGGEEYAIPLDNVKEVVKLDSLTPVPQMPEYIKGMVNVRGNIYSVLDLAVFFGNKDEADEQFNFLVVIKNEEYKVAVRIPNVPNTLQVSEDMIENFNASLSKSMEKQEFLNGIIKKNNRMIIFLNILEMISSENFAPI